MDPLSAATAFASIVGLLADFRSQRKDAAEADYQEFMTWLAEQRHEELKALIEQSAATAIGIKALLHEDRAMLAAKLDKIDRALASLASTDPAFAQLAIGIRPDAKLSSQSLDILRKFEAAKASRVYEFRSQDTLLLFFSDGKGGQLEYDDPRFIEDDLHSLVELGLLRPDQNSSGKRVYVFTRSAAELVKQS